MRNEGILWHLFCMFNATVNRIYKIHSSENVSTFSGQATFDRLFHFVFYAVGKNGFFFEWILLLKQLQLSNRKDEWILIRLNTFTSNYLRNCVDSKQKRYR